MKDVVLNEVKKEDKNLEDFIREVIEENRKLFKKYELEKMNENMELVKKIYLLGFINARQCYL